MKRTQRRVEVRAKVLYACRDLIGRGVKPTGRNLRALCRGHGYSLLVAVRDDLIEAGEIAVAQFWGPKADLLRWELGPASSWTKYDRFVWGLGPGNRNWPHPKRRDARRRAMEVRP